MKKMMMMMMMKKKLQEEERGKAWETKRTNGQMIIPFSASAFAPLIEDNARELFSTVTVAAAAIFTPPYPVRIMSYTRIYLAVAFLYLATVQLPFSAANNQITVCHRAALTLSRLYKSLWIDIRPPAGGEPTYSFASAFSLVSPWLTSSASSSSPVVQFDWPSPASIETARYGCAQPAYRAPVSSPLPAAIIQMIRYFKYEEMREGE
ncbi:hypothetical protein DAPPUDRAFT_219910 [Daphnia pulex]|uniref:Uncharacterized protein n=1 Tax=Daphnia pulex TaxID=6669 RepID=E9FRK9_DAPPU|nr:hypothetical protein DAPPUDRAFT_219910 [Daphnia pulex]|eukprot:EFX89862.1 hypothetical protein DAPPUDRAFT_219910 [Daphnia pulex]